jgi:hypothetical protein
MRPTPRGRGEPDLGPTIHAKFARLFSALTTVNIFSQGATAGRLLQDSSFARELHEFGAISLHVLSGITFLAIVMMWRAKNVGPAAALLAFFVFAGSFVEAALGHGRTLHVHVPLAMALVIAATVVTVGAWLPPPRSARSW